MPLQIDAMSVDQPSRRTAGRLRRRRSDEARIQPNTVTTISRASIETEAWRAPASEAPHHVLGYPTLSPGLYRLGAQARHDGCEAAPALRHVRPTD